MALVRKCGAGTGQSVPGASIHRNCDSAVTDAVQGMDRSDHAAAAARPGPAWGKAPDDRDLPRHHQSATILLRRMTSAHICRSFLSLAENASGVSNTGMK